MKKCQHCLNEIKTFPVISVGHVTVEGKWHIWDYHIDCWEIIAGREYIPAPKLTDVPAMLTGFDAELKAKRALINGNLTVAGHISCDSIAVKFPPHKCNKSLLIWIALLTSVTVSAIVSTLLVL